MTDAEELNFVGLWLIDIGQSMRDLSAAFQQFCEKLPRETELAHDHSADCAAVDLLEAGSAPCSPGRSRLGHHSCTQHRCWIEGSRAGTCSQEM